MRPQELATRVAALERSARRWRLATVAGLLMVVSTAAIKLKDETRELRLVSPDGKRTITLRADNDAAGVWVAGEEGVATLLSEKNGAAAGVYGPDFKESAFITAADGGTLQFQPCGKYVLFDAERLAK